MGVCTHPPIGSVLQKKRKSMSSNKATDTSDEALSKMARFTDKFNLKTYEPFLHYVPRLVNVVTVLCTTPHPSLFLLY